MSQSTLFKVSDYVAEFWNTVSNLSMIGGRKIIIIKIIIIIIMALPNELCPVPACYGLWSVRKEALETRCPSGLRMRIEGDGESDSFFYSYVGGDGGPW